MEEIKGEVNMVDGISTTDNKKTGWVDTIKPQTVNYPTATTKAMPNDELILNKKKKTGNEKAMGALQAGALVTGILASTAIAVIFGKSIFTAAQNGKRLIGEIKKAGYPEHVENKLINEAKKLISSPGAADSSQIYIDNVKSMPWNRTKETIIDVEKAKSILDEKVVGLNEVKEKIIRYIENRNYKIENNIQDNDPLVLCLNGPAGVGKTTIAEVISEAMGKKFGRMSLGGQSTASGVIGTERVFRDSSPSNIVKILQDTQVSNPVILVDELDKAGASRENGSPFNALLDTFEPKQCKKFTDKYIEIPYDLSDVTFIITSNNKNDIPDVLLNRIEVIDIPRYTDKIKKQICQKTVASKIKQLKLDNSKVQIKDSAITAIVKNANDDGARKTIENVKNVFEHLITKLNHSPKGEKINVDDSFVKSVLSVASKESINQQVVPQKKSFLSRLFRAN